MDFKIAGTQNGITGIQLDLKIDGISEEIIEATLAQSREARIEILRKMLTAIPRPQARHLRLGAAACCGRTFRPEKIGVLIGPGGKTIRGIQEATGAVHRSRGRRHGDHRQRPTARRPRPPWPRSRP